jgi:cytochrome c biogenesis protein CcmG/thiol:disulfide interchange protein DsbE
MKYKIVPFIVTFLFIVSFIFFFKGLKNSNIYIPSNDFEKEIPFFTTRLFNSNIKINSDEIFKNNKYYLMNIWSSWCAPCRDEHQYLMELSKEKNLEIIGLNYKDNTLNAKKFLNELKNPYSNIILDPDGLIAIEWGAYGVPESFLIYDKSIIKKIIGPLNENLVFEINGLIK